jgi:hypothetical protein
MYRLKNICHNHRVTDVQKKWTDRQSRYPRPLILSPEIKQWVWIRSPLKKAKISKQDVYYVV